MKACAITVTLTPELKAFVEGKVRTGLYQDPSEVLRDALRALEAGHHYREDAALDKFTQEGLDSGPAQSLNRQTWRDIWSDSDKLARTLRRKHRRAA